MPGAIVVGVGPGLGAALARRFAADGAPVTLISRGPEATRTIAAQLESPTLTLQADVRDEGDLRRALDASTAEFGPPDAVIYNAALIRADSPGDLTSAELVDAYRVNVVGALTAATHLAPVMGERGRGSFLMTSGMPEPVARYTSLSLGKAAVRALGEILHQQYGGSGVHVATVTVAGHIAPGTAFDPDDIAQEFWRLHLQPRAEWERDVRYLGHEE